MVIYIKRVLVVDVDDDLGRLVAQVAELSVQVELGQAQRLVPRRIHRVVDRFRLHRLVEYGDARERIRLARDVQQEHVSALVQIRVQLKRVSFYKAMQSDRRVFFFSIEYYIIDFRSSVDCYRLPVCRSRVGKPDSE